MLRPLLLIAALLAALAPAQAQTTFINEFHYDNPGNDTAEFVEVVTPTGTDLSDWRLWRYNSVTSAPYGVPQAFGNAVATDVGGKDIYVRYTQLQNGLAEGLALVDGDGTVVQFLSYEGTLTATSGPAAGMTSTDVGVDEQPPVAVGLSLQLAGSGTDYADFTWQDPAAETPGAANNGQTFGATVDPSLTVSLTPYGAPVVVGAYGGLVFFRARVTNDTDAPLEQDFWLTLTDTGSEDHVQFRCAVRLNPGRSAAGLFVAFVSRHAAAGTYAYTGSVGGFPSATASDAFTFDKAGAAKSGAPLAHHDADWTAQAEAFAAAAERTGGPVRGTFALRMDEAPDAGTAAVWGVADDATWAAALGESEPDAFATADKGGSADAAGAAFGLGAAYPNPMRASATIPFELSATADTRLAVYDALGREVAVLVDGTLEAGAHAARLSDASLPSGTYVIRLTTSTGQSDTQRLSRVR